MFVVPVYGVTAVSSMLSVLHEKARQGDKFSQVVFYRECEEIARPIFAHFETFIKKYGNTYLEFDPVLNRAVFEILCLDNFAKIIDFRAFFRSKFIYLVKEEIRKRHRSKVLLISSSASLDYLDDIMEKGATIDRIYEDPKSYVEFRMEDQVVEKISDGKRSLSPLTYLIFDNFLLGKTFRRIGEDLQRSRHRVQMVFDSGSINLNEECYEEMLNSQENKVFDKPLFENIMTKSPSVQLQAA